MEVYTDDIVVKYKDFHFHLLTRVLGELVKKSKYENYVLEIWTLVNGSKIKVIYKIHVDKVTF